MSEKVAFISGHVDISNEDFALHYHPQLDVAIADGHNFAIGNAPGADTLALDYLLHKGVSKDRITIYFYHRWQNTLKETKDRFDKLGVHVLAGNFNSYGQRDAAMTAASDYDIAWVRSEETAKLLYGIHYKDRISGTQKNLERRTKK